MSLILVMGEYCEGRTVESMNLTSMEGEGTGKIKGSVSPNQPLNK